MWRTCWGCASGCFQCQGPMWRHCLGCAFPGCFHCGGLESSASSLNIISPAQTPKGSVHAHSVGSPQYTPQGSIYAHSAHNTPFSALFLLTLPALRSIPPRGSVYTRSVGSYASSIAEHLSIQRSFSTGASASSSQIFPPYHPYGWLNDFGWLAAEGVDPASMVLAPSESSSIFPPDDDGVPYYFKLDGDYDNFAAYEAAGKQRRLWIANEPNQPPCFVNPSTHTIQSLANAGYNFFVTIEDPPVEYFGNQFEELQIPLNHTANAPLFSRAGIHGPSVGTMVHVGPGVLVISLLNRDGVYSTEAKPIPHTSSLMQASYQNFHHIDTLRHVFLWAVTNQDTFAFLHRFLYTAEHGLRWPSEEPRSFEYGSPEFDGLLGTRLGKLICYLVLEAWPRGTRRITRVVTYSGPTGSEGFMRFDIEPVV